jgi:hypothetical protein
MWRGAQGPCFVCCAGRMALRMIASRAIAGGNCLDIGSILAVKRLMHAVRIPVLGEAKKPQRPLAALDCLHVMGMRTVDCAICIGQLVAIYVMIDFLSAQANGETHTGQTAIRRRI